MITELRKMTPEDIDEVMKIERSCFSSEAWPREDFEALTGKNSELFTSFVSVTDGRVSGYVSGSLVAGELEIYSVAVDPLFRRKGIARALILELERQSDPDAAFLEVRQSNAPARALYASLGFEQFFIRRGYYTDPIEDAITMKKIYSKSDEKK